MLHAIDTQESRKLNSCMLWSEEYEVSVCSEQDGHTKKQRYDLGRVCEKNMTDIFHRNTKQWFR